MRRGWIFGLAMAALAAGTTLPMYGQEPELVRDIATGPASPMGSFSGSVLELQGKAYFAGYDGFQGLELWSSNGTLPGTLMVADLCPGRCSGAPWLLTPSGKLLYFFAGNTTDGVESFWLWRSDGTAAGTFPLVDLEIGVFGSANPPSYLAPFQDGVVFVVHNRVRRGWSLWRSDGTLAGTREIEPLPGEYNPVRYPFDSETARLLDDGDHHYFTWRDNLWVTDGTAEGTRRASHPIKLCGGMTRLGELRIYAGLKKEEYDCELWVSDGTSRGTRLLRDIRQNGSSEPWGFVSAGGLVYFTAYDGRHQQLWKTDGTSRGTVIVQAPTGIRGLGKAVIVGATGSRLYFLADDGEHGTELWRTEGTRASTAIVADLYPGPRSSYFLAGQSLGNRLIFTAWPGDTDHPVLFRTEGTADSTVRLLEFEDSEGYVLAKIGGRLYFTTGNSDFDRKLGVTDGTVEGTQVFDLARPNPSSSPHSLIAGPGGLVFVASGDEGGFVLWRSEGHPEDTEPLDDLLGSSSDNIRLLPGAGGVFYSSYDAGRFGWTDGRTVRDLQPFFSNFPQTSVDLGDRMLFFSGLQVSETEWRPWIWSSDGTQDGTVPVAAMAGATDGAFSYFSLPTLVPELGEVRYLTQQVDLPGIVKLAATDGTAAGTRELVRIPVRPYQRLSLLVAAGRNVFATFWGDNRASLWVSDGTAEGTREIYAIPRPWDFSIIYDLAAAGGQVFFPGDDAERGRELWVTDGTPEGTHRVADLTPGAASSTPSDFFSFGDRILFSADDREHGRELWVSDGTAEGTRLLEILPGPRGSYPQQFRRVGDQVVFAADDGVHGLESWVTDGTPEGTHLVADLALGPRASSPQEFTIFGDELYFSAGRPQEGYELWKLPLARLAGE